MKRVEKCTEYNNEDLKDAIKHINFRYNMSLNKFPLELEGFINTKTKIFDEFTEYCIFRDENNLKSRVIVDEKDNVIYSEEHLVGAHTNRYTYTSNNLLKSVYKDNNFDNVDPNIEEGIGFLIYKNNNSFTIFDYDEYDNIVKITSFIDDKLDRVEKFTLTYDDNGKIVNIVFKDWEYEIK